MGNTMKLKGIHLSFPTDNGQMHGRKSRKAMSLLQFIPDINLCKWDFNTKTVRQNESQKKMG